MLIIPCMGMRVLAITRPFLRPIELEFFIVTQETIIYQLVMRIHDFDTFFEKNNLLTGKKGAAATRSPKGMGPQEPTKRWTQWADLLSQPLYN